MLAPTSNGVTTDYTYGLERISAVTGNTRTEYVYDGRGSVSAELTYNGAWYTLGGLLSSCETSVKKYSPFGEDLTGASSGFGYSLQMILWIVEGKIDMQSTKMVCASRNNFANNKQLHTIIYCPEIICAC